MARFFLAAFSAPRQQIGKAGRVYWFSPTTVTRVDDNEDAEFFLHMGSPETGIYPFRETDSLGNPIGPFPPINPALRNSIIDTKRFPSDTGVPEHAEWRLITETYGDPTLYYHHIRRRIRGPSRQGQQGE